MGSHEDGSERPLLAFCGGWRVLDQTDNKRKCGASLLVLGQDESCEHCHKLKCHHCGYCSEECENGEVSSAKLAVLSKLEAM